MRPKSGIIVNINVLKGGDNMPGFKTHYFFGQSANVAVNWKYEAAYNIGAQGPDIFFYHVPSYLMYKKNIGSRIHRENVMAFFQALFTARCALKSRKNRQIADAYINGFMSHYILDCIIHPYIYYRTRGKDEPGEGSYGFGIHVFLETDIDNAVLYHETGKAPTEDRPWDTIDLSAKEKSVIAFLLHSAINEVFPDQPVTFGHVVGALTSMYTEQKLMHDPKGNRKKALRHAEQALFGHAVISPMVPNDNFNKYEDPCNLNHKKWKNPWDPSKTSDADVFQMMKNGVKLMEKCSDLYFEAMNSVPAGGCPEYFRNVNELLSELGDCSYLSGLPL